MFLFLAITLLVTLACLLVARVVLFLVKFPPRAQPKFSQDGVFILEYAAPYRAYSILLPLSCGLGAILSTLHQVTTYLGVEASRFLVAMLGFGFLATVPVALRTWSRFVITEDYLVRQPLFERRASIRWSQIVTVVYSRGSLDFSADDGRVVRVSAELKGFLALASFVERKLPILASDAVREVRETIS